MSADRILMLKLLGDTSSIDKSLRKTEGRLKGLGRSALSWGKALTAGLVIDGIDKVTDALGDAWDGFREGQQAAGQLGATWKNLGLDGSKLSTTLDEISASTIKLGTDDVEAINAFNTALKTTGGDSTKAMQRLRIAQNLVANGSAPNLAAAMGIIQQAAKGSARTVDKFGLTAGTAGGRVKELGEKVKGAAKRKADLDPLGVLFNRMNEDLEGIVGSLASGELDDALTSLRDIGASLNDFWDKVGPKVTAVLDKLTGGTWSDAVAKFQTFADEIGPKVGKAFDAIATAWAALQPHLQNALTVIQPLNDILSNAIDGGLGFILNLVTGSLNTVAALLKGDFSGAFTIVQDTVGKLGENLNEFFQGLPDKFLNEWIPDIAEAAGDLGGSIVTSIITLVSKLPGKLIGLIRDGVNGMIGVWNSLDFAIPRFDLPSIDIGFPSTGNGDLDRLLPRIQGGPWNIFSGTGDLIPDLPKLAKGGIVNGPTLALIGEAGPEAVVPLGRGGGMGNVTINVMVPPTANMADVGREITRALNAYRQGGGQAAMKSAIGVA